MFSHISPASWYLIASSVLFLVLFSLFVLFYFKAKRKQVDLLLKEQAVKNEFERTLLNTQLEIQEQTLRTISQEIHDNVGQVLTLAKLNLNTFYSAAGDNQQKLNDTVALVSKAINDLRDLSRSINGDKIADLGLKEAVENELKILHNTGQYKTFFTCTGQPGRLANQAEIIVFRMVQECLNNILKHAKATEISAAMDFGTDLFSLHIRDNGQGFNPAELTPANTGIGMKNMTTRAAMIGASLELKAAPGNGANVGIHISNPKYLN